MIKLILASLFLCGCASTTFYENGKPIMKMQGDATNVTFHSDTIHFHADVLNHSMPTLSGGQAAAQVVGATGTVAGVVAGAVATGGIVK